MQGIEIPIGAPLGKLNQDLDGAQQALKGFTVAANGDLLSIGKSLGTLERQLKVFKDGVKNSTDPSRILLLNNAIKATETQLAGTRNAINGVGFNKFTTGSNQAAFALTNLGRVAQDAPFGFIGIQNNLNPLLESFQQLRAQNTSLGATFKALGQSLIGPAGLGIALSLVTAAFTFYTQYQQRANKGAKEAVDANKELADSIKSISGVQAEGRSNASKDLSQLQSLYNATQNANIPAKERLKIADDLIKRYPKYLSGLTAEQVLAGKAASAYISLTNAILAKGYAQAAEENRQKLINQQLNAKVEITKEQAALDKSAAELSKRTAQKQATLDIQGQAALEGGISKTSKAVENSKNKINELNQVYKNAASEIKILDNVTQGLIKTFGADVVIDPEKIDKLKGDVKTVQDILKALDIDKLQIGADVKLLKSGQFIEEAKVIQKAINDLIGIGVSTESGVIKKLQQDLVALDKSGLLLTGKQLGLNLIQGVAQGAAEYDIGGQIGTQITEQMSEGFNRGLPVIAKDLGTKLKVINQALIDFNASANDIIQNSIINTFNNLGTAVGEALATGGNVLNAVGNTILQGLAGFLSEMGSLLIKYGTLAVIKGKLDIAILTGGPIAIGAGLAAIAVGIGLKAAGGAIGSLAKAGNGSNGAGSVPVPQGSSTISTSAAGSAQDFGGGRVVFEISGTNLVGVLNRAGAKLQRFGP